MAYMITLINDLAMYENDLYNHQSYKYPGYFTPRSVKQKRTDSSHS